MEDLQALGVTRQLIRRDGKGTIHAMLSTRELYAANVFLRSATRVVVSAFTFTADSFPTLERRLRELDWSRWVDADRARLSLRVTSHNSALYRASAAMAPTFLNN